MHRSRDDSRWTPTRYGSVEEFLAQTPGTGAHAIRIGVQHLDLLVEDRGADATLVVFHSALTERHATVPVFQGRGAAAAAEMNLVSVADPSLEMGDVDLAWFLGNRFIGALRPLLSPVIRHVVRSLGSSRTILMGGSGGGYAAILFAQDFPDCAVLALNPRLDLTESPFAKVDQYLRVCHKAAGITARTRIREAFVPDRLADELREGLNFDLLIWQNLEDTTFLEHQLKPFLHELGDDPRLRVRFDEHGPGHRPVPTPMIWQVLSQLAEGADLQESIPLAAFYPRGVPPRRIAASRSRLGAVQRRITEALRAPLRREPSR